MAKKTNKKKTKKTATGKTKKTVAAKSKKSASTKSKAKGTSLKTKGTTAKSKRTAAKKITVKKGTAKKTTAKKVAVKKPAVKKAPVKKAAIKKPAVKKAPAKKATVKKAPAKKSAIKKAPLKKRVAKTAPKVEVIKKVKKLKKVKGYPKNELTKFKKVILAKREEIIEQLQNLKDQMMDPTTGQYVNESSPYSLHMAEQGTDAQEREKLYLWAQRENKFLGYLEDALQRIESGTYGLCIECIDEPKNLCPTCPLVPKERLLAVPHTQLCVEVKMKQNKK